METKAVSSLNVDRGIARSVVDVAFFFGLTKSRKVVPSHSTPKGKETIVCECGQQAVLRTVKKNGPTKGKTFYNCSKPVGSQCKFYKWADEPSGAEDSHTHLSGAGRKRAAPSDGDCKQSGYPKRPHPLTKRN
eukprot:Em0001g1028a